MLKRELAVSQETILTLLEHDTVASRPNTGQSRPPLSADSGRPNSCVQHNPLWEPVDMLNGQAAPQELSGAADHADAAPDTGQAGQGSVSDLIDLASSMGGADAATDLSSDPCPLSSSMEGPDATTSAAHPLAPQAPAVSSSMQQLRAQRLHDLASGPRSQAGAQCKENTRPPRLALPAWNAGPAAAQPQPQLRRQSAPVHAPIRQTLPGRLHAHTGRAHACSSTSAPGATGRMLVAPSPESARKPPLAGRRPASALHEGPADRRHVQQAAPAAPAAQADESSAAMSVAPSTAHAIGVRWNGRHGIHLIAVED